MRQPKASSPGKSGSRRVNVRDFWISLVRRGVTTFRLSQVGILFLVLDLNSATLTVVNTLDHGPGSLRQAIQDANAFGAGDITFSNVSGTISLTSGELAISANVSILGPSATSLAISGSGLSSVLYIQSNATVAISGLTIRDGASESGGGIYNQGALSLSNCVVTNNDAEVPDFNWYTSTFGGGIYNGGVMVLDSCFVTGNRCAEGSWHAGYPSQGGSGGGIYNASSMFVIRSSLKENQSGKGTHGADIQPSPGGDGGGIYNAGILIVEESSIDRNWCGDGGSGQLSGGFTGGRGGSGGGVWNRGTLVMSACTLSGNRSGNGGEGGPWSIYGTYPGGAGGVGGAVCNLGLLTVTNCTFAGNLCGDGGRGGEAAFSAYAGANGGKGGSGGAIWNQDSLTLCSATICGNAAGVGGEGGDGYPDQGLPLPSIPSTSPGARGADGDGGGIFVAGDASKVLNTLLANNTASGSGADVAGSLTSLGHNLIGSTNGSSGFGAAGDMLNVDPQIGPLAANGGPTLTCALLPGSPAIDAGTAVGGLPTDQRGIPRPYDVPTIGNAVDGSDIGAYEWTRPPTASKIMAETTQNQPVSIPVEKLLLSISSPDGYPLTLNIGSTEHSRGNANVVAGTLMTYTPPPNFIGTDSFTFVISDDWGGSASGEVIINVIPDPAALSRIFPPVFTPSGVQVRFHGVVGRAYSVQRAPAVTGPWTTVGSAAVGPNGVGSFEDTGPLPCRGFYRTSCP